MFSCKYSEIFKNTYFEEHLRTAAFELLQVLSTVKKMKKTLFTELF